MSPLTRVDALVAAAVLTVHPGRQPTWAGIAARLTAWAHEQPPTEHEEGEMPSQTGFPGSECGTIRADKRPRGAVNTPRADHLTVKESM